MSDFSNLLSSGVEARLIPTVADAKKEERTTSVLLAALMAVPCFARSILATIGKSVGVTAKVQCFTEVRFVSAPEGMEEMRPDGLIVVITGRKIWSAIVEAKVEKNTIQTDQLKNYLALAKVNGVDAVITISNQMVAHPSHHPVQLGARDRKRVDLFHWSWMRIKTMALLLLDQGEFASPEQRWILREATRYFEHDGSGILGFTRMNAEWKDVVTAFQNDLKIPANSDEIVNTVASWHQERRDLCLLMTRELGQPVEAKLSNAHKRDPLRRLRDDCDELTRTGKLTCSLKIEGAADLDVIADLRSRRLICTVRFKAPTDRKRHSARIHWLTRQLLKTDDTSVVIYAHWPGRAPTTHATLGELRDAGGPEPLIGPNGSMTPHTFDVSLMRDLSGRFSRPKVFIEELERLVPEFYSRVGQHVTPFQEPTPKLTERKTASEEAEVNPTVLEQPKSSGKRITEETRSDVVPYGSR